VFQIFLFTCALLIRARVCAQRPYTKAVCAGDCHQGIFLSTSALLIRESILRGHSDPTQRQSALGTVIKVFSYLQVRYSCPRSTVLFTSRYGYLRCVSTLPIYNCTIDSRSSLRSATPHNVSLRWRLSRRFASALRMFALCLLFF